MSTLDNKEHLEELHQQYLQTLVEYHNAFIKFTRGRHSRAYEKILKTTLKKMQMLTKSMAKEVSNLRKSKIEENKDKYEWHRTKNNGTMAVNRINNATEPKQ